MVMASLLRLRPSASGQGTSTPVIVGASYAASYRSFKGQRETEAAQEGHGRVRSPPRRRLGNAAASTLGGSSASTQVPCEISKGVGGPNCGF